jgi:hypothetical protein
MLQIFESKTTGVFHVLYNIVSNIYKPFICPTQLSAIILLGAAKFSFLQLVTKYSFITNSIAIHTYIFCLVQKPASTKQDYLDLMLTSYNHDTLQVYLSLRNTFA